MAQTRKFSKKPASRIVVGSGRSQSSASGKKSWWGLATTRWGLAIMFVGLFGGLGAYLLIATHAASFYCSPTSLAGHPLVCAQPCPSGTTGNRDAKGYYYCFGQAKTSASNCQTTNLANTLRCNFGCPTALVGGLSTDHYFYCHAAGASALSTCSAVTLSGKAAYRCGGTCPSGYSGSLAVDGYFYCFANASPVTVAPPAPTANCSFVGSPQAKSTDGKYLFAKPDSTGTYTTRYTLPTCASSYYLSSHYACAEGFWTTPQHVAPSWSVITGTDSDLDIIGNCAYYTDGSTYFTSTSRSTVLDLCITPPTSVAVYQGYPVCMSTARSE